MRRSEATAVDDAVPESAFDSDEERLQSFGRAVDAGIDLSTSAAAAKMLRRHLSKAAAEVSRHFLTHLSDTSSDASTPERVTEAFETLRPVGLEVVQLIFAQEMEKALRKAVESGRATAVVRRST